jgi:hypothetical protein
LMDSDGDSLIWSFRCESHVAVCRSIQLLSNSCFSRCQSLSILTFEFDCTLRQIDESAFRDCFSFRSICIPSSVEILGVACFQHCRNVTHVSFEPLSVLPRIGAVTFAQCSSLQSICIPSWVVMIDGSCFADCRSQEPDWRSGNRYLWMSLSVSQKIGQANLLLPARCRGCRVLRECNRVKSFVHGSVRWRSLSHDYPMPGVS